MPCYHPIPAYQDLGQEPKLWPALGDANTEIPCGYCLGCRANKATLWARRATHEANLWQDNCFVTLTYNDKELPPNGHLEPRELQLFFKRLRKARAYAGDDSAHLHDRAFSLRYLACGEYGERGGRPHYHLLLFNHDFADKYPVAKGLCESSALAALWTKGTHKIGTLTGASANYVAQYALKKQGRTPTECDQDGVVKPPPFLRMSLKPAIGAQWLDKNKRDLTHGYLVTNGTKGAIPRYYRQRLKDTDPSLWEEIDYRASLRRRKPPPPDRTIRQQLDAEEKIHEARVALQQQRN